MDATAAGDLVWPLGVVLMAPDDTVESVDGSIVEAYGRPHDFFIGRDWLRLGLPRSHAAAWTEALATARRTGEAVRFERPSQRFGRVLVTLLPRPDGRVWTMSWALRAQASLQATIARLRGVQHDLRNVLTKIVLRVEALTHGSLGALRDVRELAERATSSARLDPSVDHAADAAPIVAELVAAARAVRPSVRVLGHSSHQVPETALRIGLGTLLDNALEASGADVEVDVTPMGAMLRIEVRDHGPGIAPELAPRLFTPGASTKGRHRGEGLAVARDVARAAGGDLRCEALHPTVFALELPRTR